MKKSEKRNPRSNMMIKTRFAIKFVEAMKKLNKKTPAGASKHKRYLAVRAAARVSMASAVGPRRAWSRAVLKNVVNVSRRRRRNYLNAPDNNNPKLHEDEGEDDHDRYVLGRLVPGGEGMGYCRLLSESAHYIMCLRDQVQVMTTMLHLFSN